MVPTVNAGTGNNMGYNTKKREKDFPFTGKEAAVILVLYALLTISFTIVLL
jgi:hypothetical protein